MGYILYGARGTGSSIIEATLAELEVDYDLKSVDVARSAQREAAYASVNPHRKVPTLVTPAGETLTESVAIILTLLERHPQVGLLPPVESPQRAFALRWLLFAATELYPLIEIIDYPERFTPQGADKTKVRDVALELWRTRWQIAEAAIGDGPYLLGAQFCATDVYWAVLSRWDLKDEWRSANLPKIVKLAAAVAARPKLQARWAHHFPPR